MYRYSVYGLSIASDSAFPELDDLPAPSIKAPVDVELHLRRRRKTPVRASKFFQKSTLPDGTPWLNCARVEEGFLLRYVDFADFIVDRAGSTIRCCTVEEGVSATTVRHLVLDQVFPMLLNLRGCEAIHATAIVTERGACAFTGPAGAGKSTLAASFSLAGYAAMGDDCLALIEAGDGGEIRAIPAYPGMRLWTEAARALDIDGKGSHPVADYTRKRRMLSTLHLAKFPTEPQPLTRIYRLIRPAEGEPALEAPVVEELAPTDAFIELVSSTFPLDVDDRTMLERHFRFMQAVVARVPIKRLRIPNDHAALPAVRACVLADVGIPS
ncbi:MAG TPA: hypothetical protein VEU51_17520 [Candidatus Acidoferrales bacterium]|nr:hypothetical protein [Candidatus Acidoferrales bacterium]